MNKLTFDILQQANVKRIPQFKNKKGGSAHSKPDGSDWLLSQWSNATAGELGELANLIKKVERGDYTLDEARTDLGKEIADVIIYANLLAFRCGIYDLGQVIVDKFNEVSDRVNASVKIADDGSYAYDPNSLWAYGNSAILNSIP